MGSLERSCLSRANLTHAGVEALVTVIRQCAASCIDAAFRTYTLIASPVKYKIG